MKVKITGCSNVDLWYSNRKGEEFEVEQDPHNDDWWNCLPEDDPIKKSDCEVITTGRKLPNNERLEEILPEDNTPDYYDNTKGSVFKIARDRNWNGYTIDIVRRLERAELKGEFFSDIDKAIVSLELYKKEIGYLFKDQYEKLNK